jgi:hypothetical protein
MREVSLHNPKTDLNPKATGIKRYPGFKVSILSSNLQRYTTEEKLTSLSRRLKPLSEVLSY